MPFVQLQKHLKQRWKIEAYRPLQIASLESFLYRNFAAGRNRTSPNRSPDTQTMGRKSQRPATEPDNRDIGSMWQRPRHTPAGDQRQTAPGPEHRETEVPSRPQTALTAPADPSDDSAPKTRGDLKALLADIHKLLAAD
ncbi:Hypothetical predicted protein [Pelobates cultripes]|uniref:Uncharacterized protein n=1 Tax=Pelobates cultripes TaxID=61616 RepID=A0AAD1VL92_PELCU|nr:Hypothetical predicted protein [Pelobates cultripes]